jgi:predicted XRE-type DNA-binding protein
MARPRSDEKQRFLSKVNQAANGCHEWTSVIHRDGYGKFYFRGKQTQAHRVAFILFVGETGGKWVLHKCDNRKCVNPDHLFLGDSKANVADMYKKARNGSRSKLTQASVSEINSLLALRFSQAEIARKFGVDQTTISRVKLAKTSVLRKD